MRPETIDAPAEQGFTFGLERCEQVPPGLVFLFVEGEDQPFMISSLGELGTTASSDVGWKAEVSEEIRDDILRRYAASKHQGFSLGAVELATEQAVMQLGEIARQDRAVLVGDSPIFSVAAMGADVGDRLAERLERLDVSTADIAPDFRQPPAPSGPAKARSTRKRATKVKRDPAKERKRRKSAAKARRKNRKR